MFSSLRSRLWLTHMLVAGVVTIMAGLAVFVYVLRNPPADRREAQRLRLLANLMARRSPILNLPLESVTPARLQDALNRADTTASARFAIFDSAGKLVADSRAGQATALPLWPALIDTPVDRPPLYRDSDSKQWVYVMAPLDNGYTLLAATPRLRLPVIEILRDEFLRPMLRGLLLALLLSFFLAYWVSRWVSASLSRLGQAAHSVARGQFQTIPLSGPSEIRAVAAAFNEMTDRVQASQRSQRDFVANVSHDLKTPLTSIQGFAQAILDGTAGSPEAARQSAQVIYSEAERMHRMVLDLLDLARLDAGTLAFQRAPLQPGEMLQSLVERFSQAARQAGVALEYAPVDPLPPIIGDAQRLGQVFDNLLDNAIKYTPAGGQVQVAARLVADYQLEVRIADSGPGIPPDELERIFERFYQTDKARRGGDRRGVGLGLAIARDIVQAHGGAIQAQNRTPEPGSVFIVRLPGVRPTDETFSHRRKPEAATGQRRSPGAG